MLLRSRNFLNLLKPFRKNEDGVTAIEFSIIAGPLFLIIFLTIELGLSLLAEVFLENAVGEAARMIRTGQVQANADMDGAAFRKLILDRGSYLVKVNQDRLYINVESFPDFGLPEPEPLFDENGVSLLPNNWLPGGRSDVVLVRVVMGWPLMLSKWTSALDQTGAGERALVVTEIFRNEPFSTGSSSSGGGKLPSS